MALCLQAERGETPPSPALFYVEPFPHRRAVADYVTNAVRNDVGFGAISAEGAPRGAVITIVL